MNAKLNNRLVALEESLNPRDGIADTIRRCCRERLESSVTSHVPSGGPITEAILKARAARELKGE
jgi:hypothetical protein